MLKRTSPRVVVIGTRGYPSYYGGFETAVRHIAPHLADEGWEVVVYSRKDLRSETSEFDGRVLTPVTRGVESKALSTLSYGLSSTIHALVRGADVALVMNVANGFWLPLLRLRGIPVVMNVDGIEWERAKWGRVAKIVFRVGARLSALFANTLIVDAAAIGRYWSARFRRESVFIPYGADEAPIAAVPLGLTSRTYVLLVARFVPENTVAEFFAAVPAISEQHDVVIVGSTGYGGRFDEEAQALASAHSRVRWLGHVSDDRLLHGLWQHAGVYFHGHSVGGTNPALVQAMMLGAPIVARDTVYNREVLGDDATFAEPDSNSIANNVIALMNDPDRQTTESEASMARAKERYTWRKVNDAYNKVLSGELRGRSR
ncbi:glycosyl transferase [Curtobacterium sp. SGAir0471]|nr:glycosyl transferase [Curtobacterium sp. SGAir0471]